MSVNEVEFNKCISNEMHLKALESLLLEKGIFTKEELQNRIQSTIADYARRVHNGFNIDNVKWFKEGEW